MILVIPKDTPRRSLYKNYDYSLIGSVLRQQQRCQAQTRVVHRGIRIPIWRCSLPRGHPHAHIGWFDHRIGGATDSFCWYDNDPYVFDGLPFRWDPS